MDKAELSSLLKDIRKFEKTHFEGAQIKIAVLGSFSLQYFVKILRYMLSRHGYDAIIYEGEYNGINMDVFDKTSELYKFNPNYVIVLPYYADIHAKPRLLDSEKEIDTCIKTTLDYYSKLWKQLGTISNCRILESNYVIPPIQRLGNLERQMPSSITRFYQKINDGLIFTKSPQVTIVDSEMLAANIGKYQWFDYPAYFLNKAGVRLEYMPEFVMLFVRQISALRGNTKKCLVLDLDNTLWGGIVGDDGWDGVQIDPNNAVGEAYRFFQSYILSLKERGIILAVCSKNDEDTAKQPFIKNENMLIHLDDISCFIANWEDKASNIRKIAQMLNIGTDSLVFFDDNPAEREIVKQYVPEVAVVDVPQDPALYVLQMQKENHFEWLQITKEDLERTNSYKENEKRQELMSSFVNYDEYLKALEMCGEVADVKNSDIGRFVQLINKSNQFNLRTIRYTEADIQQMLQSEEIRCLYVKIADKFSNYGIISCVILKKINETCFVDTWVMSCRVLKRGIEWLTFERIRKIAAEMGCSEISAEYIQTKKNSMVQNHYENLGFDLIKQNGEGVGMTKQYTYKKEMPIKTYYITTKSEEDKI